MSLLSKKFFDSLPSSVEFNEEIKDYITSLIDDLDSDDENLINLREITEQFLIDAGVPENDIEKIYIDLVANNDNIAKNSSDNNNNNKNNNNNSKEFSDKVLNKLDQVIIVTIIS